MSMHPHPARAMTDTAVSIGEQLRSLRGACGLTQEALAERSGISVDLIKKLEQGQRKSARLTTLVALADALGAPLSQYGFSVGGRRAGIASNPAPDAALEAIRLSGLPSGVQRELVAYTKLRCAEDRKRRLEWVLMSIRLIRRRTA